MLTTRPTSPVRLESWAPRVEELERMGSRIHELTRECRSAYHIYSMVQSDLIALQQKAVQRDPKQRDLRWRVQLCELWKEMRSSDVPAFEVYGQTRLARLAQEELEPLKTFVARLIKGEQLKPSENAVFSELWKWSASHYRHSMDSMYFVSIPCKMLILRRLEKKFPTLARRNTLQRDVLMEARELSCVIKDLAVTALDSLKSSESLVESLSDRVRACTQEELENVLSDLRSAKQQAFEAEQAMSEVREKNGELNELRQRLVNLMISLIDCHAAIPHPTQWHDLGHYSIPITAYRWEPSSASLMIFTGLDSKVDCQRSYWLYWDEESSCLILRSYAIPSVQDGSQLRFDLGSLHLPDKIRLRTRVYEHPDKPEHITILRPSGYDEKPQWTQLPR